MILAHGRLLGDGFLSWTARLTGIANSRTLQRLIQYMNAYHIPVSLESLCADERSFC